MIIPGNNVNPRRVCHPTTPPQHSTIATENLFFSCYKLLKNQQKRFVRIMSMQDMMDISFTPLVSCFSSWQNVQKCMSWANQGGLLLTSSRTFFCFCVCHQQSRFRLQAHSSGTRGALTFDCVAKAQFMRRTQSLWLKPIT